MNVLSLEQMEGIEGGKITRSEAAGFSCFAATIGTVALIASGPAAPGIAMFQGWALGHAWGLCLGLTFSN